VRDTIAALMLGLVLGAIGVLIRAMVADRYRSGEEAAEDLNLPLLGSIPRGLDKGGEAWAEAFRQLRVNLSVRTYDPTGTSQSILIVGPVAGVGKSFVARGLATAYARVGRHAVLVDGDLRRPTLHREFEVDRSPGLAELLLSGDDASNYLRRVLVAEVPGELELLPAGPYTPAAVEQVGAAGSRVLLQELQSRSDAVVIDTPPVLAVSDASAWARYVTGVLFVLDRRKTKRRQARAALRALTVAEAPLLGVIVDGEEMPSVEYDYMPRPSRVSERA
jgi:receptor protein-tyrosine kinase